MHSLRLADPMAPVLRLLVHRRIPVRVVEDDRIGSGEVDADAAATSRRDKAENPRVVIESIDQSLPVLRFHRAVQPHVNVPVDVQELFKDIEHSRHLRKDDDLAALIVQSLQ